MWVIVAMTVLCALASLGVDYGRVQVVKSELRRGADAAARAAASNIADTTKCQSVAVAMAAANTADGKPILLEQDTDDIQFVNWDSTTRTYTVLTGADRQRANAIRIRAECDVPLVWGSMLGKRMTHVEAVSVCTVSQGNFGIVGIDSLSMTGRTATSYWSATGSTGGNGGHVASNGDITLSGGATIDGDAYTYTGTVSGGVVAGMISTISAPLVYPPGDATPYFSNNNNSYASSRMKGGSFSLGQKNKMTLPGGNYVFKDFTTASNSQLTFSGPATVYCYGNASLGGQTLTNLNLPRNLKIVMCQGPQGQLPGSITITAGSALYADIYAPQSTLKISGSGAIYGSVVGKVVTLSGSGAIHNDLTFTGHGRGLAIVK